MCTSPCQAFPFLLSPSYIPVICPEPVLACPRCMASWINSLKWGEKIYFFFPNWAELAGISIRQEAYLAQCRVAAVGKLRRRNREGWWDRITPKGWDGDKLLIQLSSITKRYPPYLGKSKPISLMNKVSVAHKAKWSTQLYFATCEMGIIGIGII